MTAYRDFFAGKRATLIGLGLLGRGVGDAAFLAELGAQLTVTDHKSEAELAASLKQLAGFSNIRYVLGEHRLQDFQHADMVIKAAGVPLESPYIKAARDAGVAVYMSTALFAKFARQIGATMVGITGTRGKSTVTHLIHHALGGAGRRAHLGGNVRGLSTLALLPDVRGGDIAVLELDSWQLQGFGDLRMSPEVAVFTNLLMDHLNYYPDMDRYFADKANIFKYQKASDTLVVGAQILDRILGSRPPATPLVPKPIAADWQLHVRGAHNRENAALAGAALRALGLAEQEVRAGLESFRPVEGRLQFVTELRGIKIYNDNNATTPDATVAALQAFPGEHIVLIAGGADKGIPLDTLIAEIKQRVRAIILLPGTGTDRLAPQLKTSIRTNDMAEALQKAFANAKPGDVLLLSPGFASFGLFTNEYERNDAFLHALRVAAGEEFERLEGRLRDPGF
jgi:UDP-N-acetylmuramoylalanine--D-glutamate ligase